MALLANSLILNLGEMFRYTSGAVLETPVGTMQGSYTMLSDDGDNFNAQIPQFTLSIPRTTALIKCLFMLLVDIQGCFDDLLRLLDTISFNENTDQLCGLQVIWLTVGPNPWKPCVLLNR